MRYTPKFLQARFEMAMDALGLPHDGNTQVWMRDAKGHNRATVGVHFIDNYPLGGGRVIVRMATDGGGEMRPFSSERMTPNEFKAHLDGILGAASVLKR